MRGLIYREVYLGRKTYISGLVLFLLLALFGILMRISINCGNLSRLPADILYEVDQNTYNMFSYLPAVILFVVYGGDGGVCASDFMCRWHLYSYTLPVSPRQTANVKYLIKLAALAFSFLLGVLNTVILAAAAGRAWNAGILRILLIMAGLTLAVSALYTPLMLKYRSANAVGARVTVVFLVLYLAAGAAFFALDHKYSGLSEEAFEQKMIRLLSGVLDKALIAVCILGAAALAAGYFASCRLLERRDKQV